MSILARPEILRRIASGRAVLFPYNQDNVRLSSIDVTLGRYFYRVRHDRGKLLNPCSEASSEEHFAGPYMIKDYNAVYRKLRDQIPHPINADLEGIPEGWPVLVLRPRERVLAHTHEFVGHGPGATPEMRARSTWGRLGIAVCLCAGMGDPGYINRWTMEVHNTNDKPVIIPLGERIAQIVLHSNGDIEWEDAAGLRVTGSYGREQPTTGYRSKYQDGGDLASVIERWRPEDMLPKAYLDSRVPPIPVGRSEEDTWQ